MRVLSAWASAWTALSADFVVALAAAQASRLAGQHVPLAVLTWALDEPTAPAPRDPWARP